MRATADRKAPRAHLHCQIDARLLRSIKQVSLDANVKIRELISEILEPEIERRLRGSERGTPNPK